MREARVRQLPNYDAVCFHCQQYAEKYLKAFLQQRSTLFPKTHDLIELLELCVSCEQRKRVHRFDSIDATAIRLVVRATHGDPSARVFEVRVY